MAINIESGTAYDLDEDIQDLRKSVGRLKQVSMAIQEENQLTRQIMEGLVCILFVSVNFLDTFCFSYIHKEGE